MSKQVSPITIQFDDLAEGSTDKFEKLEPFDPFKTSTMPMLSIAPDAPTSDTGINATVDTNAEASENENEQDGALTSGESAPIIVKAESIREDVVKKVIDANKPILIVEDTSELAEVIEATIENMGLEADTAAHGERGLDKFKAMKPDIILLDIGLPDMTGWKFLDNIKEMHKRNEIKEMPTIIVITAYDDPANRLVGKLQNIHSYLVKPFTPDKVEELIRMALRGEKPEAPDFGLSTSPLG